MPLSNMLRTILFITLLGCGDDPISERPCDPPPPPTDQTRFDNAECSEFVALKDIDDDPVISAVINQACADYATEHGVELWIVRSILFDTSVVISPGSLGLVDRGLAVFCVVGPDDYQEIYTCIFDALSIGSIR